MATYNISSLLSRLAEIKQDGYSLLILLNSQQMMNSQNHYILMPLMNSRRLITKKLNLLI